MFKLSSEVTSSPYIFFIYLVIVIDLEVEITLIEEAVGTSEAGGVEVEEEEVVEAHLDQLILRMSSLIVSSKSFSTCFHLFMKKFSCNIFTFNYRTTFKNNKLDIFEFEVKIFKAKKQKDEQKRPVRDENGKFIYEKGKQILKQDEDSTRKFEVESGDFSRKIMLKLW